MKPSNLSLRVYYEDTDCGNVVYYANYLRYMERGRTELFREIGFDLGAYHKQGVLFAVIETNVKYRASAHYNDLITVETSISEVTSAWIVFSASIYNQSHQLLVTSSTKLVCINGQTGKAMRIPEEIKKEIGIL